MTPATAAAATAAMHEGSTGGIAYLAAGDPAAPPLVFLHGIGGAARGWTAQLAHFAGRFRAVAWSMPGYGGSAPPPARSVDALAAALVGLLRALDLRRPVLVGHSIGGMIVQRVLAEDAHPVRAAVLAQTSPAFGSRDGAFQERFLRERLGPLDAGRTMAELADGLVAGLVGDDPDPAGVALARELMARTPDAAYRASMLALTGFDSREALGRIRVPVLVLSGTRDTNAPTPMMERMAARIPGARYIALEGVGHLAPLEQPARFDAALDAFLADLPRP